jgi:hypothetical protein
MINVRKIVAIGLFTDRVSDSFSVADDFLMVRLMASSKLSSCGIVQLWVLCPVTGITRTGSSGHQLITASVVNHFYNRLRRFIQCCPSSY